MNFGKTISSYKSRLPASCFQVNGASKIYDSGVA